MSKIILCLLPVHFCTIMEARELMKTTVIRISIYYPDSIAINSLDIADGLKELLNKYGFTLNELLNMPSSELAEFIGIDKYVAQIIGSAATRLSNIDKANEESQTENYITF